MFASAREIGFGPGGSCNPPSAVAYNGRFAFLDFRPPPPTGRGQFLSPGAADCCSRRLNRTVDYGRPRSRDISRSPSLRCAGRAQAAQSPPVFSVGIRGFSTRPWITSPGRRLTAPVVDLLAHNGKFVARGPVQSAQPHSRPLIHVGAGRRARRELFGRRASSAPSNCAGSWAMTIRRARPGSFIAKPTDSAGSWSIATESISSCR